MISIYLNTILIKKTLKEPIKNPLISLNILFISTLCHFKRIDIIDIITDRIMKYVILFFNKVQTPKKITPKYMPKHLAQIPI
jgi:putative effector of murein hydrolase LrgA (UPF0299 family)